MDNKKREIFVDEYFNSDSEEKLKMVSDTCNEEPLLYRYRSMENEHDFHALEQCYFWQHTLNSQNDEREGLIDLTFDSIKQSSSKVIRKICSLSFIEVRQVIKKMNSKLQEQLIAHREPFGVVCFSESRICEKMWKEYANEYQGICISYSKKKLVDNLFHIVPVLYKEEKDIYDYCKIGESKGKILVILADDQTEKVLISKTVAWNYEGEWRHIEYISVGNCIPAIKPEKIYIGFNCSAENVKRIIDYCTKNDVEFEIQEKV